MRIKEIIYRKLIVPLFKRYAYLDSELIETAFLHKETFLPYKNYCNGEKDVVVCGAGPTLNKYKPIEGAIHIAVNRAFLYDKVSFDFIFAQDYEGINMVEEQLINYRRDNCVKFLGTQPIGNSKKVIPESLIIKAGAKKFNTDWFIPDGPTKGKLIVDIDKKPLCNMYNVGQSVMQLALYFNPRRIYIVGCDMSGNHFARGNQTDEQVETQRKIVEHTWATKTKELLRRWSEIKEFAKIYYPDTEIISVNPVGLKGMFKDLYQD